MTFVLSARHSGVGRVSFLQIDIEFTCTSLLLVVRYKEVILENKVDDLLGLVLRCGAKCWGRCRNH